MHSGCQNSEETVVLCLEEPKRHGERLQISCFRLRYCVAQAKCSFESQYCFVLQLCAVPSGVVLRHTCVDTYTRTRSHALMSLGCSQAQLISRALYSKLCVAVGCVAVGCVAVGFVCVVVSCVVVVPPSLPQAPPVAYSVS